MFFFFVKLLFWEILKKTMNYVRENQLFTNFEYLNMTKIEYCFEQVVKKKH